IIAEDVPNGPRHSDEVLALDNEALGALTGIRPNGTGAGLLEILDRLSDRVFRRFRDPGSHSGCNILSSGAACSIAASSPAAPLSTAVVARINAAWRGSIRSGPSTGSGTGMLSPLPYQGTVRMLWFSILRCSVMKPYISACGVGGQPGT